MYDQLQTALCYRFRDPALLRGALTHSSYANENKNLGLECNERLEFLGDSILGFVVAEARVGDETIRETVMLRGQ